MSPLLRQFMLISVIGMTALMLSLLFFYVEMNQDYLKEHLDAHNKNLAVVLRNSLVSKELEAVLRNSSDVLPQSLIRNIGEILDKELRWVPVTKVKVFSKDAVVLYSSEKNEIGSSASNNVGFLSAIKGQSMSSVLIRDKVNPFDHLVEKRNLHQQYVPIINSDDNTVIGVFEVYTDITEILLQVSKRQQKVFWSIALILMAFYLALLVSFLRTHKVMEKEKKQRKAHLDELNTIQMELEQRVLSRTRELSESKTFLQSVIDGISNPLMVIRPDFRVSLMNEAARKLIPPNADPQQYRNCYQISHRRNTPCEAPDHPCSFGEVMNSGCEARLRHTHYDADNNPIIVDLLTTPLYSADGQFEGVIEVEHDITQLVEMQQGLEKSQAHLQAIMANVPEAIVSCDEDCRILSVNQATLEMFNCREDELLGIKFNNIFCRDISEEVFTSSNNWQAEEMLKKLDASQFPAEIWIGHMPLQADSARYLAVIRDISERIKARDELDATRQQYFHQEKMAAIGYLAAGILHEVGNPIAAIAGAASGMKETVSSHSDQSEKCPYHDYIQDSLELIDEQTHRLGKITTDIANFASPREQDKQLVDLNGILRSTMQLMAYDQRFNVVEMQLDLDTNLPAIEAVADQLTQVFMNLLMNAKDAFDGCENKSPYIRISTLLDEEWVVASVEDNGCGMSDDALGHATEAFYTTKPVGKGSGLGLSLCNKIVHMHGGKLLIESQKNNGTRVKVVLPIK